MVEVVKVSFQKNLVRFVVKLKYTLHALFRLAPGKPGIRAGESPACTDKDNINYYYGLINFYLR